jgi:predicted nucleic acid-binding Zn ribbon protein
VVGLFGGTSGPDALAAVFARWEEIAGPDLAGHVRPVRLADGVLVVAVDHPAWATKVRSESAPLRRRAEALAGDAVVRLDVIVRPP